MSIRLAKIRSQPLSSKADEDRESCALRIARCWMQEAYKGRLTSIVISKIVQLSLDESLKHCVDKLDDRLGIKRRWVHPTSDAEQQLMKGHLGRDRLSGELHRYPGVRRMLVLEGFGRGCAEEVAHDVPVVGLHH